MARNLLAIMAAIIFSIIIGAPYWIMDIETPFIYGVVWTMFAFSSLHGCMFGSLLDV